MYTLALAARAVATRTDPAEVVELGAKFTNPVVVPDDDTGVEVGVDGTVSGSADGVTTHALPDPCGGQQVLGMPTAVVRA
jgi:acyl dehydratase